ncbi:divergent polysaccharide deacetylase family protein [Tyzzerella sp. OttesenSCG-928-J15]|nr:divergent polysaccharide deacetylase family protein [Tyzzerella sp. OttesenSCG-928-J15]
MISATGGDGTKEFLYMDTAFTGAVMPNCPYTDDEARQLLANGKEVIIHMPMEPENGSKSWLPEGAILSNYSEEEAKAATLSAIGQIKGATGINNHMGSKVMENKDLVTAAIVTAKENNLYFVDSLTTSKSKAKEAAEENDAKIYYRNIFLDGTKDVTKIEKNLKKAGEIAVKDGYCIAIGHVGQEGGKATAQAISNMVPKLNEKGVKLVTMSQLIGILEAQEK